jgi:putative hydrolase of the HAD superfamily
LHLTKPEAWWENIYKLFETAYINNGIVPEKASLYAKETRRYLIAPEYFCVYDDTIDTLEFFKDNGYRNIILSNHIPELPEIAESLGLMEYIDICISSANIGYEKPNPEIFRYAVKSAGNPRETWMIGDSLKADVHGAEAVGIKAILVRTPAGEPVKYYSPDLKGIINIINQ